MRDVQCGARQICLRLQDSSADICTANIKSSPEFAAVAIHLLKEPFVARGSFDGTEAFNMHGHPALSASGIPQHLLYQSTQRDQIVAGIFIPLGEVEFVKCLHGGVAPAAGVSKMVAAVSGSYSQAAVEIVQERQVKGEKYIRVSNNSESLNVQILGALVSAAQHEPIDYQIKWTRSFMHARATPRDSCVRIQMWRRRKPKGDRFKLH